MQRYKKPSSHKSHNIFEFLSVHIREFRNNMQSPILSAAIEKTIVIFFLIKTNFEFSGCTIREKSHCNVFIWFLDVL